jgi:hypothetical protein
MYTFKHFVDNLDRIEFPVAEWEPWRYSFSQAGQDLFVVAMLQGKTNGTFLELGASQPKYSNNTYILENKLNFTGISIDIEYEDIVHGNKHLDISERSWPLCRPNTHYFKCDALTFDYSQLPDHFDYLQVDIDPAINNLVLLEKVLEIQTFSVITFEHDIWNTNNKDTKLVKEKSQSILKNLGYELVVDNVTIEPGRGEGLNDQPIFFEDWYANPLFVPKQVIDSYKWLEPADIKYFKDILFR